MTDDMLCRSVPFELRAADGDADGNTLFGYAAVFDRSTRIDSWEGVFDEDIEKGAFARSLGVRTPVLQFDHGKHPMVGSIPLGYFRSLAENEIGLEVDAPLHDNWLVQPVRDAIKSKAIPGMSFRFSVVADLLRTAKGVEVDPKDITRLLARSDRSKPDTILRRTLRDMDLFELGPVVFPAYTDTTVGVRSRELITLLSDPQVRAEAARFLAGTPSKEPRDAEGASATEGHGDAATEATRFVPSPEARKRDLLLEREIR